MTTPPVLQQEISNSPSTTMLLANSEDGEDATTATPPVLQKEISHSQSPTILLAASEDGEDATNAVKDLCHKHPRLRNKKEPYKTFYIFVCRCDYCQKQPLADWKFSKLRKSEFTEWDPTSKNNDPSKTIRLDDGGFISFNHALPLSPLTRHPKSHIRAHLVEKNQQDYVLPRCGSKIPGETVAMAELKIGKGKRKRTLDETEEGPSGEKHPPITDEDMSKKHPPKTGEDMNRKTKTNEDTKVDRPVHMEPSELLEQIQKVQDLVNRGVDMGATLEQLIIRYREAMNLPL